MWLASEATVQGRYEDSGRPRWRPVTLRTSFIAFTVALSLSLVGLLLWLLYTSNTHGGILFATNINELPLHRTFSFQYLPTIVAVLYGFLWTWIDLDVKRLEPYYQLSTLGGVSAKDSLLLSYPFDFVAWVPFRAFRNRHWPVFVASTACILATWALTPFQSAIFAIRNRTVSVSTPMISSTSYTPVNEQNKLTSVYAQHVANIVWLNESLPPFMTRDAILSSFSPEVMLDSHSGETWTGVTTLYSIDVDCIAATYHETDSGGVYNGTNGCSYMAPPLRTIENNDTTKDFDTIYVGSQDFDGYADYYLADACPSNRTFLVRMSKTSRELIENSTLAYALPLTKQGLSTTLYCTPQYYSQQVNATVDGEGQRIVSYWPVGEKSDLSDDIFDIDSFEWSMNSFQAETITARGDFPTTDWPDQKAHFQDTQLDLAYFPKMCAFALACYRRPLEDYLDAEVLRRSYEAAYRLLFVRQMADILQSTRKGANIAAGIRVYDTQALVLVPIFTWIAIALLLAVTLLSAWLSYFTFKRRDILYADPASISATMSQFAGDDPALQLFSNLDKCSDDAMEVMLRNTGFALSKSDPGCIVVENVLPNTQTVQDIAGESDVGEDAHDGHLLGPAESPGVRPAALRWYSGSIFLAIHIGFFGALLCFYLDEHSNHGIPLPSRNIVTRKVLEDYIPLALSALLESFWILLSRLICILLPFEKLRLGDASSYKSISLEYSAVPPQFSIWSALRLRHYLLVAVCLMALLTHALAVAVSGLFYEDEVHISKSTPFRNTFDLQFNNLDGSDVPFNSHTVGNWQGGTTRDELYIAMSNVTADTRLPTWTTNTLFYLPFNVSTGHNIKSHTAVTPVFGANLRCQQITETGSNWYNMTEAGLSFRAHLAFADGSKVTCKQREDLTGSIASLLDSSEDISIGQLSPYNLHRVTGRSAFEFSVPLGPATENTPKDEASFCREHIVAGWWRADVDNLHMPPKIASETRTVILCKPQLVTGSAEVTVDGDGQVLQAKPANTTTEGLDKLFESTPSDLIGQANQFIMDNGATWHNDSFPSDFLNYLIQETANNSQLLDPAMPVPSYEQAVEQLTVLYNKLFAILLGYNQDILFRKSKAESTTTNGWTTKKETRIFVSTTAFIVSESILGLYNLTTILVYVRRPWRILPRLPTTIASVVAFFAASDAIKAFKGTARMTEKERRSWLDSRNYRWAFGTFSGSDLRGHLGIEREPFVDLLKSQKIPTVRIVEKTKLLNGNEERRGQRRARWYAWWRRR